MTFDPSFENGSYDRKVLLTIPGYRIIHESIGTTVKARVGDPDNWLDVGCGTGKVVLENMGDFPHTEFTMADPSKAMLDSSNVPERCLRICSSTDELKLDDESQDVITAVLCHHYYDKEGRKKATENCYRMLREGGLYLTVEHTAPDTEDELLSTKAQWKEFLIGSGRTEDEASAFVGRYGTEYFPITAQEHLDLLRSCGFRSVGIFVHSCMDTGYFGVK